MKNTSKNVQKNREISKEVEEILELNEIFYSISKPTGQWSLTITS